METVAEAAAQVLTPEPTYAKATYKVFDPATGTYVEQEMQVPATPPAAPYQQQTVYAPQPQQQEKSPAVRPQTPPPVLVYNEKTGQYEPQYQMTEATPVPAPAEKKTTKTTKQEKTIAEKMLDNFTRSTASGAGYSVGRTISRGILGVFGIK
jgi:hypothetical protein